MNDEDMKKYQLCNLRESSALIIEAATEMMAAIEAAPDYAKDHVRRYILEAITVTSLIENTTRDNAWERIKQAWDLIENGGDSELFGREAHERRMNEMQETIDILREACESAERLCEQLQAVEEIFEKSWNVNTVRRILQIAIARGSG